MNAGLAALLLLAVSAGGALAQDRPATLDWLIAASGDPGRSVIDLGEYHLDGSGIMALDPLTGFATKPAGNLPAGPAQVHVVQAYQDGFDETAALVLTLGPAVPVCGLSHGTFGVDTGLAAILNKSDADKLDGYGRVLDLIGSDLFTALETQLPMDNPANFVTLPEGTRFPVSRSGYGDGAYKLYLLNDARGAPVALYVDFIGDHKGEWIDPPPCANV